MKALVRSHRAVLQKRLLPTVLKQSSVQNHPQQENKMPSRSHFGGWWQIGLHSLDGSWGFKGLNGMLLVCVITKSKDPGETYPQSSLKDKGQDRDNRTVTSIFGGRQMILNTERTKVCRADISQLLFSAQFGWFTWECTCLPHGGHKSSRIGWLESTLGDSPQTPRG